MILEPTSTPGYIAILEATLLKPLVLRCLRALRALLRATDTLSPRRVTTILEATLTREDIAILESSTTAEAIDRGLVTHLLRLGGELWNDLEFNLD